MDESLQRNKCFFKGIVLFEKVTHPPRCFASPGTVTGIVFFKVPTKSPVLIFHKARGACSEPVEGPKGIGRVRKGPENVSLKTGFKRR